MRGIFSFANDEPACHFRPIGVHKLKAGWLSEKYSISNEQIRSSSIYTYISIVICTLFARVTESKFCIYHAFIRVLIHL